MIGADRVRAHLFVAPQNNSGSTFLTACLHRCRRVIALPCEGQHVPGFRGPVPGAFGDALVWGAAGCRTAALLATESLYDWPVTRRAWLAVARPASAAADLLVEKSPPNIARLDQLDRHVPGSRFLLLVRDPFAVAESVIRGRPDVPGIARRAGEHVVTTLGLQRANAERYVAAGRAVLVRYEDLCDDPTGTEARIRALVPELDDLCVRRRLAVKGRYDRFLANLNAEHHARLGPRELDVLQAVFSSHAGLLGSFGYSPARPAHPGQDLPPPPAGDGRAGGLIGRA